MVAGNVEAAKFLVVDAEVVEILLEVDVKALVFVDVNELGVVDLPLSVVKSFGETSEVFLTID